jgi:hypothetical protein
MLAGSDKGQSSAVSGALVFDTGTGAAVALAGSAQLWRPRAFASVTEFGPGFLVAGGEDPTISFSTGRRLHNTAEVFVADQFAFDPDQEITLKEPRSRHAAVRLSVTETLLIGGRTEAGTGEAAATPTLELVDYTTGYSRGVGLLTRARVLPKALLLDDGTLFVAGGVDGDDELVPGADWIVRTANGDFETSASDFPSRFDQDFVALPGGAVLAVGGCEDRAGSDEECAPCRRGCRPEAGWDAFWISKDRDVVQLSLQAAAPRPRLISAPDGAPYLVPEAGSEGFEAGAALLRFDPWDQVFRAVTPIAHPPELDLPVTGLDAGAAVWVTDAIPDASLVGQRFSTRNEFAQDLELITLVSSTNSRWPLHLAPGQGGEPGGARYARLVPGEAGAGSAYVLEVAGGAAVWLTDARFADFSFQVTLDQGKPPDLLIDSTAGECHWPAPGSERPQLLTARRTGTRLELTAEAEASTCELPSTRVAIGLRAGDAPVRLSRLSIHRDAN